ncbi:PaaI family thioesterase [Comamonas sp. NoAH]|uniref:PaaI family thioesterase n=1 Tax=Comamonas halotolerans TaxID=3041496 RepID=UPI0024E142AC|nr:PaaI family thioesterase [Comamonas sp. NoAH]
MMNDNTSLAAVQAAVNQATSDRNAFMRLIGATQIPAPEGKVRIHLPHLRDELLNQLPAAHGGVLMTLFDAVMSRAAGELAGAPSQTAVTVEMSSRFHRPGKGALLAEGWVVHASRSLCSCAGQITDEKGSLLASATGTFKYWLAPTTLDTPSNTN